MSFPISHLLVAKYVVGKGLTVKNMSNYYLGAVGPDAVHYREDYTSQYKLRSHLCIEGERWGLVVRNEEWIESVLAFLARNEESPDWDYIQGHCVHILTDIYNNIQVWTPFRLAHYESSELPTYNNLYHSESAMVDFALYQRGDGVEEIMELLRYAICMDIEDIVGAVEMERIKNNLLYKQYKEIPDTDVSHNQLLTWEDAVRFIEEASEFVYQIITNRKQEGMIMS